MGKWVVVAIYLLSANPALADGYLTGQKYRAVSDDMRSGYVTGAYDTLVDTLPWLIQCTNGWGSVQLTAVFDKYLTDRPQYWNFKASSLFPYAIGSVCPSAPAQYKDQ